MIQIKGDFRIHKSIACIHCMKIFCEQSLYIFEILQSWILYQTTYDKEKRNQYKGLNVELYLSMGFALFHTIVEGAILILEARALKISPIHYTVICMNG